MQKGWGGGVLQSMKVTDVKIEFASSQATSNLYPYLVDSHIPCKMNFLLRGQGKGNVHKNIQARVKEIIFGTVINVIVEKNLNIYLKNGLTLKGYTPPIICILGPVTLENSAQKNIVPLYIDRGLRKLIEYLHLRLQNSS